jgi:flagellar biosynthesis protein FlhF
MRVLNQITFEAKDDAEALRLAGERLGKDAVILSTRPVYVGGLMGLFRRRVLMVSAGILQNEQKEEKIKDKEKDDVAAKERLVAFQKLLEFKQAAEARNGGGVPESDAALQPAPSNNSAKIIYSPAVSGFSGGKAVQEFDSVHISQPALVSAAQGEKFSREKILPAGNGGADTAALREEVSNLSRRLDTVLRRLEGVDDNPGRAKAELNFKSGLPGISVAGPRVEIEEDERYRKLLSAEVEPDYARQLMTEYREQKSLVPFVKWLASKVRCSSPSDVLGGRKVMLLGSTGVGKTTTIAKLAAKEALWEHKNVLLLTSDTYRIAAVDQLRTYAKILGVPIEVIFEEENFASVLAEHSDVDLMLLDTAGRGHRDRKNLEALETVYDMFRPDAVHLVLAANMKYRDMLDVVERMSVVPVSHLIFTKLDETVSYGALFNTLKTMDCPVSFFTTGQNVPNDIEVASGARLAGLLIGDEDRGVSL